MSDQGEICRPLKNKKFAYDPPINISLFIRTDQYFYYEIWFILHSLDAHMGMMVMLSLEQRKEIKKEQYHSLHLETKETFLQKRVE